MNPILWEPSSEQIEGANVTRLIKNINAEHALVLNDFEDLHAWSIEKPEVFWQSFWPH